MIIIHDFTILGDTPLEFSAVMQPVCPYLSAPS